MFKRRKQKNVTFHPDLEAWVAKRRYDERMPSFSAMVEKILLEYKERVEKEEEQIKD